MCERASTREVAALEEIIHAKRWCSGGWRRRFSPACHALSRQDASEEGVLRGCRTLRGTVSRGEQTVKP